MKVKICSLLSISARSWMAIFLNLSRICFVDSWFEFGPKEDHASCSQHLEDFLGHSSQRRLPVQQRLLDWRCTLTVIHSFVELIKHQHHSVQSTWIRWTNSRRLALFSKIVHLSNLYSAHSDAPSGMEMQLWHRHNPERSPRRSVNFFDD